MNILNIVVRYTTMLIGLILMCWVISANYQGMQELVLQTAMFFFWVLSPFYTYFFISRKDTNFFRLLLPALLITVLYIFSIIDYFTNTGSTSALMFLSLPIAGFIFLGLGYLVVFFVDKRRKRVN